MAVQFTGYVWPHNVLCYMPPHSIITTQLQMGAHIYVQPAVKGHIHSPFAVAVRIDAIVVLLRQVNQGVSNRANSGYWSMHRVTHALSYRSCVVEFLRLQSAAVAAQSHTVTLQHSYSMLNF
jgi:hypothetical protein